MSGSQAASSRSVSSSLDRAREVLLSQSASVSDMSSSAMTNSFMCTNNNNAMTSSVEMQSSREEEHEQELSSMLELENLRKSVGDENPQLLLPSDLDGDESWVLHLDDKDAEAEVAGCEEQRLHAKAPRVSDTSQAPTERRDSELSNVGERDRRISTGWLAVEDALAASVSELTDSLDDF